MTTWEFALICFGKFILKAMSSCLHLQLYQKSPSIHLYLYCLTWKNDIRTGRSYTFSETAVHLHLTIIWTGWEIEHWMTIRMELMLGDCPSLTSCDCIAPLWWLVASYWCCSLSYKVFSASLGELFKFAFYALCQGYLEEGWAWLGGTHFHEIIGKDKDVFHATGVLVSFRLAEFITKILPGSEKENRKILQRPLHRWPYNYGSHDFCHQWTLQFLLTMLLDFYHATVSFCYSKPIILFPPRRLYTMEKVEEEEEKQRQNP